MTLKIVNEKIDHTKFYGGLDDIDVSYNEEKQKYSFLLDANKRSVCGPESILEVKDRFRVDLDDGESAIIINDKGVVLSIYTNPEE